MNEIMNDDLIEKAYKRLSEIMSENHETAMMQAGNYLVENFYGNDIELARKKKSPKKETLNQLIKRFKDGSFASPSKSWIYQSIG
ncbi:MAG: hypothetical protein K8S18_13055, partial [Desulfobacula sp.]|nr:hypothetical protein [Desulfobacula sp.]